LLHPSSVYTVNFLLYNLETDSKKRWRSSP
jgi:hypothetical protein